MKAPHYATSTWHPKPDPDYVNISELELGDVVQISDTGPFMCGVVRQIVNGNVIVFRVYATTADFTYTGGRIPYIGVEEVSFARTSTAKLRLWQRHKPPELRATPIPGVVK